MRIARVLTRANLGGPARQVLASDPLLREAGHEVRLFVGRPEPGEGDLFETLVAAGLHVVRVPHLVRGVQLAGDLLATRFLRRALRDFAPDVVHTHTAKAGALGRRAARALDAAVVHTYHGHVLEGYFPPAVSRVLIRHETRLARRTDRILCVSHATADDLVRLGVCDEEQLVVVPPGVDLDPLLSLEGRSGELRQRIGAAEDAFVVGMVGRLAEVKQPELALDVFERLATRHPRLHLAFIGDGDQRGALERRMRRGGEVVAQRVHLLGARDDMPAVLSDLDLVLSTSRSEGAPVSLIEAAAAGLPVVARDVGGVSEIVAHERTGFLGLEPDELAYGLAQYLDSDELCRATGHRARLRVAKRHSASALADRLAAVYASVGDASLTRP